MAGALRAHHGKDGADDPVGAEEIGVQQALEICGARLLDTTRQPDTGAVHENVDSSEVRHGGLECGLDTVVVKHVERRDTCSAIRQLQGFDGLGAPRGHHHRRALVDQHSATARPIPVEAPVTSHTDDASSLSTMAGRARAVRRHPPAELAPQLDVTRHEVVRDPR